MKCKYVTPNNFKNREVNDTRILKATVCCYALMISRHANDDDCYMRIETGSSIGNFFTSVYVIIDDHFLFYQRIVKMTVSYMREARDIQI